MSQSHALAHFPCTINQRHFLHVQETMSVYNVLGTFFFFFVRGFRNILETFSVHNGWSALVVLLFRNPHLLESGERRQDGPTDPH